MYEKEILEILRRILYSNVQVTGTNFVEDIDSQIRNMLEKLKQDAD